MFGFKFEDIPVGQRLLKYIISVNQLQSEIEQIKLKLAPDNLSARNSLADIEAYFDNQEVIKYKAKYTMDKTGNNFDTLDEEEQYNYDENIFLSITNNLKILGIKYKAASVVLNIDANGKKINHSPIKKNNLLKYKI